ncbi:L-seryl-tRNA(Sec) kinase [Plasmodium gonderi]|uniref:L-seryl-tRNA(Sec) kinase n=1 Tax=Plasmodium gonderi TaxID=77519 RepID=A0A1Y1JD41_PLAGO|nr:L-seryl-tRNA(Sec) kinase [Plasmodium gonderi]GAW79137.1 L-seryl-tRNA(Sec) kinase [Plasmodium gonderi]
MNCIFLFYGKPCSGKDTLINSLLKKKRHLQLFLYLLHNLITKNESRKNESRKNESRKNEPRKNEWQENLKEKLFFIELIKHYYKIKNLGQKKVSPLSGNHGKEADLKKISCHFLIYLTRHLLIILRRSFFSTHSCMKKIKKLSKEEKLSGKTNTKWVIFTQGYIKTSGKIKNEISHWEEAHLWKFSNSKIRRLQLVTKSRKINLIYHLYKTITEWICHFLTYLGKNKIKIYNISTDFIEKQLYHGYSRKIATLEAFKKEKRKQYRLIMNKKYIVYERKKFNYGAFYPIVRRKKMKNEHIILRKMGKGEKRKKPTHINQIKYWKIARHIAYSYCSSLMHEQNQKKNISHGTINNHTFIILNDTFHLPSMRKKYYLLSRRYHFKYAQIYLNAPLKMCLERNRRRKKFKPVADKTIVRNHFYHQKYALWMRRGGQTISPNMISVIRGGTKWQKGVLSIQVDSSVPQKLTEIMQLIYNHLDEFKNEGKDKKVHEEEQQKRKNLPNRLDVLNITINKIIHKNLKILPNEKKNEYAKKFRLIKLKLLKGVIKCIREKIWAIFFP